MAITPGPQVKDLDQWSRELDAKLRRARLHRINETELREDANPIVVEAARDLFGLSDLGTTAERRPGKNATRRRYDKLYWGVVVEWEWRLDSDGDRDHAAQQALDYLGLVRQEEGYNEAFTAVVCNGEAWGFLAIDDEEELTLFGSMPTSPRGRFEWRANSPAACRRFLELIGSHRQQPVTAAGLASAFGPASVLAKKIVTLLAESLGGRSGGDRADTLYKEWRRSLDVVYGNLDAFEGGLADSLRAAFGIATKRSLGELLFPVHTYFSLVARILAIEILALAAKEQSSQPTNWGSLDDSSLVERLAGIDAGHIPASITVHNLFEADVFSWYRDALDGNIDLLNAIREVLTALDDFALPRIAYGANPANDLLRDLYQSLVPRVLRKALGEFLTPAWLAEACLSRLQGLGADLRGGRVLDPTCGTGTFLLPILRERVRRLRAERSEGVTVHDVQAMLDDVVGIDINPVAVTAARVNMVTALGELTSRGTIRLPIWRADSILLPDAPALQGVFGEGRLEGRPWRALQSSLERPFPIPPAFATAPRMATLRLLLESAMDEADPAVGQAEFLRTLEAQCGPAGRESLGLRGREWDDAREVAVELHDRIRALRDAGRNGVWARIIENSFAPLFAGTFDVVVGNPPWLTWTRMPDEWRAKSRLVWMRYGLWRVPLRGGRPSRSLASGDIATLVFATALYRYGRSGAFIGLLMPQSIVSADPGNRAFRQFRLRPDGRDLTDVKNDIDLPFRPLHLDDWSAVKPFAPDAANSPVFLAALSDAPFQAPVPTVKWQKAGTRLSWSGGWQRIRPYLRCVEGESSPVDPTEPASAWSFQGAGVPNLIGGGSNQWEFGKGLDTRGANGVYFVQVVAEGAPGEVVVENDPKAGRNKRVRTHRGTVEADLVYPLLRGRDVRPWAAHATAYIVAPHRRGELGRVLPDAELLREFPKARTWLRYFASVLRSRRSPPNRSWAMDGDDWCRLDGPLQYMDREHLVVVRELDSDGRAAAAVVHRSYWSILGRSAMPLIDHKLSFCAVTSADEATYVATVLNSTPIQDLLGSFANAIAVSPQTLARLPIPGFDLDRGEVRAVVEAGLEAAQSALRGELSVGELDPVDRAVSVLLGVPQGYRPQPTKRPRAKRRGPELPGVVQEVLL
jgi:SAM-dependent methyltransferase